MAEGPQLTMDSYLELVWHVSTDIPFEVTWSNLGVSLLIWLHTLPEEYTERRKHCPNTNFLIGRPGSNIGLFYAILNVAQSAIRTCEYVLLLELKLQLGSKR